MALSKFFDSKAIDFQSSFPSSTGGLDLALCPISLFLSLDSLLSSILNVSRDPISSSSLILFKYFASLIVVALYTNLDGKDLKAFFTSFYFGIFSPRANDSLTMSHNFPMKPVIVSSSIVFELFYKQF